MLSAWRGKVETSGRRKLGEQGVEGRMELRLSSQTQARECLG